MKDSLLWAAGGTGFTFLMTTLGAAIVFFFRKKISGGIQRVFLGFAAGVMIAASVWSLLIPAIEEADAAGKPGWIPAAGGFVLGVAFLMLMDSLLPHLHPGAKKPEGLSSSWKRTTMLVFAVTLHNIPEGMAVGLSFALAAQHGNDPSSLTAAMALALGIGIQNFPEGAAVALPLRQEGLSTGKSFALGSMSGFVEPLFGILTVLIAGSIQPMMPWLLAFAAGAMLYVVVEELIPQAHLRTLQHWHTWRYGGVSHHDDFRRGPWMKASAMDSPGAFYTACPPRGACRVPHRLSVGFAGAREYLCVHHRTCIIFPVSTAGFHIDSVVFRIARVSKRRFFLGWHFRRHMHRSSSNVCLTCFFPSHPRLFPEFFPLPPDVPHKYFSLPLWRNHPPKGQLHVVYAGSFLLSAI